MVAKDELDNLLGHGQLGKRVPILFLANKMDLPTALAPVELAQASTMGCAKRLWLSGLACGKCSAVHSVWHTAFSKAKQLTNSWPVRLVILTS